MSLFGRRNDLPDWIFQGLEDVTEDHHNADIVKTITQLMGYNDTSVDHVLLLTNDAYQWYADVTLTEPTLLPTTVPAAAPTVLHGYKGRIWKAITSPNDDLPDRVYNRHAEMVDTPADIGCCTDPYVKYYHLLNEDADVWYVDVSGNVPVPAPNPLPVEAPAVILGADGRTWQAVYPKYDDWIAEAELT